MKFCRYGPPGEEQPGLIDDEAHLRDLSPHLRDIKGVVIEQEKQRLGRQQLVRADI